MAKNCCVTPAPVIFYDSLCSLPSSNLYLAPYPTARVRTVFPPQNSINTLTPPDFARLEPFALSSLPEITLYQKVSVIATSGRNDWSSQRPTRLMVTQNCDNQTPYSCISPKLKQGVERKVLWNLIRLLFLSKRKPPTIWVKRFPWRFQISFLPISNSWFLESGEACFCDYRAGPCHLEVRMQWLLILPCHVPTSWFRLIEYWKGSRFTLWFYLQWRPIDLRKFIWYLYVCTRQIRNLRCMIHVDNLWLRRIIWLWKLFNAIPSGILLFFLSLFCDDLHTCAVKWQIGSLSLFH